MCQSYLTALGPKYMKSSLPTVSTAEKWAPRSLWKGFDPGLLIWGRRRRTDRAVTAAGDRRCCRDGRDRLYRTDWVTHAWFGRAAPDVVHPLSRFDLGADFLSVKRTSRPLDHAAAAGILAPSNPDSEPAGTSVDVFWARHYIQSCACALLSIYFKGAENLKCSWKICTSQFN